ncbi:MAG: TRAP transporter large permease subunit [Planctomycetota bacterium]
MITFFIDSIPAIIIVGTILSPLADSVAMHPIYFAIIGITSIAHGLVTPPCGLCLVIACTVGGNKIKHVCGTRRSGWSAGSEFPYRWP